MTINQLLAQNRPLLSFEVFPPKQDTDPAPILAAAREIAGLSPDFMSVTYGAGGGASYYTGEVAAAVQTCGVPALAHLTCLSSTRREIHAQLASLRAQGLENILALRGDPPKQPPPAGAPRDYRYAAQLIADIRAAGPFCVGGACYPEGHVECSSQAEDLDHLKEKVDQGCDFLVTQMFFDNSVLYSFLYRALARGIEAPVIAGVMPVTNAGQIARIVSLSGTSLPNRFRMIVDKFGHDPAAMRQAGVAYATEQIVDLIANGVRGVHVYAMNKPDVAAQISANLSSILGR
ncbi:MAG: methylenetetrahydrofolate reductase [NAD(P)H] [Clostridiales bacterium]|nr:methylenetetrahydrofolate reductase [NAD(P)H] [Clostridiales bacterium]